MMAHRRMRSRGFTIVEMLVVIGVIGVLMALVTPAVISVRVEAHSTQCLSNLRQIFGAVEIARQQQNDLLPYAAALPVPPGQTALVEALPQALKGIMKPDLEVWRCPADLTDDSELLGTSYAYVAGAFMMLEPPIILPDGTLETFEASRLRVARLVTDRYVKGYLRHIPLVVDSGEYHRRGNRDPHNAVFLDGNARVMVPKDNEIVPPEE